MMRKQAGKAAQRRPGRENPAQKRRKINDDNEYEESRRMEMRKINNKVGEKRKPDETTPPSPKSHRKLQQDIRLFINKDVSEESRSGRVEPTEFGTAEPLGNFDGEHSDWHVERRNRRAESTESRTAEPVRNVDGGHSDWNVERRNGRVESTECGTAEPVENDGGRVTGMRKE